MMLGLWRRDDGLSLVEIVMAMAITMIAAALVLAALTGASRGEAYTARDSEALANLRAATQRLSRELRQSGKIFQDSTPQRIRFWVDYNRDGLQDAADRITWEIATVGGRVELHRYTDAAPTPAPWVNDIVQADAFGYNLAPPQTTLVTITLAADGGDGDARRVVTTDVRMRNVPG